MYPQTNSIVYQPVIILGAARSGTNMLRDVLTKLPSFGTWPCDEINYIWRHGNIMYPTDELPPEAATETIQAFIRRAFNWVAQQYNVRYVVEKTCANTLRIGFVNRIIPDAQFIHIIRDGRDVVASARKRWSASLDIPYLMRKARFVPLRDLPYYSTRYLWNRVYRITSPESRLAFWGPRFEHFDQIVQQHSLIEVCAFQWHRSMEKATQDLAHIAPHRVYQLHYEHFVANPTTELVHIGRFLGLEIREDALSPLVQDVSPKSVGNWQKQLTSDDLQRIEPIIGETLRQYGYS